jgi:hypothetical protein
MEREGYRVVLTDWTAMTTGGSNKGKKNTNNVVVLSSGPCFTPV